MFHGWTVSKRPHTETPTQALEGKKRRKKKPNNNPEGREERALKARLGDGQRFLPGLGELLEIHGYSVGPRRKMVSLQLESVWSSAHLSRGASKLPF